ncbi:aminoglycoside phosphotransferase family protein [Curtobacterium pusillum]|uniref:aminoglycoside phosphotransferase family protein n=1 Tax=Curtobacterium pusillum TaxID=69373 RepID=UPI00380A84A0
MDDGDGRARSALDAVLRDLGASWSDVEPLTGGSVNHTVRVRRPAGDDVVIRVPVDPLREDEYPVEAWASAAAERAGIAVARVLCHGRHDGTPFLLSEYVEPDPRPITEPWRRLGAAARAIGTIALVGAPPSLFSRFGTDPATAWRAHVAYNVRSLDGDDPLLQAGAYTSASALRAAFEPLGIRAFEHGLAHGDLAPRNLLSRGPDAAPVVIDWGAAEVGPMPWTDARRVFGWWHLDREVSEQEFGAFAAAAGLGEPEVLRTLGAMTALHLVDVARWARERRPDQYREYVAASRRGLRRLGLSD